jgi:8-oxo-dGTP pyrophosphatase MutT (NUDIX family)
MAMSEYIRGLRDKVGHDLIFQPTAACLIRDNNGRILLVRHVEGWWTLPAGAVDPGETPAEAARRETREEASVEVELLSISGVFGGYPDFHAFYPNGDEIAWVATVFEARITSGVPALGDDETGEVRWVTLAEAFELGLTPGTRHMLTRIGEGLSFDS